MTVAPPPVPTPPRRRPRWLAGLVVLAIVALAGTAISARAMRRGAGAEWVDAQGGGPRSFMAWVGVGMGALFALVIANQLAASLLISPCLR